MKHISITGRPSCASARARQLYADSARAGLHVVLDAPGGLRNSLPERRLSAADVLITVTTTDEALSETTTD